MRFLVDAQLPRLLAEQLGLLMHDAIHVEDLPKGGLIRNAELLHLLELHIDALRRSF